MVLRPLRIVRNDRGEVRKSVRNDDGDFPGFGQVHVVTTLPGVIRAWFQHVHQTDQLAPVVGLTRLGLIDDRADSPTRGAVMDLLLDSETPAIVRIPPLVWHGFTPVGGLPSIVVQHDNRAFVHAAPDEFKLPPDAPPQPLSW